MKLKLNLQEMSANKTGKGRNLTPIDTQQDYMTPLAEQELQEMTDLKPINSPKERPPVVTINKSINRSSAMREEHRMRDSYEQRNARDNKRHAIEMMMSNIKPGASPGASTSTHKTSKNGSPLRVIGYTDPAPPLSPPQVSIETHVVSSPPNS